MVQDRLTAGTWLEAVEQFLTLSKLSYNIQTKLDSLLIYSMEEIIWVSSMIYRICIISFFAYSW